VLRIPFVESLFRPRWWIARFCELCLDCAGRLPDLVFACQWRVCGFPFCGCGLCPLAPDGYPDQYFHINGDVNPAPDLYPKPYFYADTKPDANIDGYTHRDGNLDEYVNGNIYGQPDKHADAQQDTDSNKYADVYTHEYCHSNSYIYSYADLYAQPNTDFYGYSCASATFYFPDGTLVDLGDWRFTYCSANLSAGEREGGDC
jgi:hypothetical protein